jgi:hypothetical protein
VVEGVVIATAAATAASRLSAALWLGCESAIAHAWITMHPSGAYLYLMFTQGGANLGRGPSRSPV